MRIVVDLQGAQNESRFRGIGRAALCITKAMARNRGKDDLLVALNGSFADSIEPLRAEFADILPAENIRVWHAFGPTRYNDSANAGRRAVAERLRESFLASLRPDVVVITSHFEGLADEAISSLGRVDDTPTAVMLHDLIPLINPDEHFRHSALHQGWYRDKIAGFRRAKLLLAVSDSARREAIDRLEFDEDSVVKISNACDEKFRTLSLSSDDRQNLLAKYKITKPFVMYTGGADERKNLDRLIIAYGHLPASLRKTHQMVMVGKMPGREVGLYQETAGGAGLSGGDSIFTGYVEDDDLVKLYNSCTLFAFPSLHEGFGIPPLEAMACGVPVIGANTTSLPEVIGLEEALFDPYSVAAITASLQRALQDEGFRDRLRSHGKQQVKRFSWDNSAKAALEALRRFERPGNSHPAPHISVERTSLFGRQPLKILLIKLDHIGDFLLAIPAIRRLFARYPDATIDIIVGGWNLAMAKSLGLFHTIHAFDVMKRSQVTAESADPMAELDTLLGKLRYYDIAIDLRRQPDTRWLLGSVQADLRVGYQTFDDKIDAKVDLVLPSFPDRRSTKTFFNKTSASLQMLRLVDSLPSHPSDYVTLSQKPIREAGTPVQIALFPKAGDEVREWGGDRFSALAGRLAANPEVAKINVYLANQGDVQALDVSISDKIVFHIGLPLEKLSKSIGVNAICIANNSGGAHLASYLGITVLTVFSGHELVSEWSSPFDDAYAIHSFVPCSPCHHAKRSDCPIDSYCLTSISVDDVYGKVMEVVAHQIAAPSGSTRYLPSIGVVRSDAVIISTLIDSIAPLTKDWTPPMLAGLASAIASNHPNRTEPFGLASWPMSAPSTASRADVTGAVS